MSQNPNRPEQQYYQYPTSQGQPQQGYPQQAPIQYQQAPPVQYQQAPQGYQAPTQGYQQPQQYQQAPPQQAPQQTWDPDSFVIGSAAESATDFVRWPEEADGVICHLQVVDIRPPESKEWPKRDKNGQPVIDQFTGRQEMTTRTQIPFVFEVIGNDDGFDLSGQQVRVWLNPSMNEDSHFYGLWKAAHHGRIDPQEKPKMSWLQAARVKGPVTLGPPKGVNGARYPTCKSFSPFRGELAAGSPQAAFLGSAQSPAQVAEDTDGDSVPF